MGDFHYYKDTGRELHQLKKDFCNHLHLSLYIISLCMYFYFFLQNDSYRYHCLTNIWSFPVAFFVSFWIAGPCGNVFDSNHLEESIICFGEYLQDLVEHFKNHSMETYKLSQCIGLRIILRVSTVSLSVHLTII